MEKKNQGEINGKKTNNGVIEATNVVASRLPKCRPTGTPTSHAKYMFRARIPVANSITAMEVWLLACIILVFLTLVEYAVILREEVISKRNKRKVLSTTSTTLFELKKENLSNTTSVNSIHHQIEKSQEAIQVQITLFIIHGGYGGH